MIAQGDVCWADLADPAGSEPGFRRPVVVVQGDAFNRSRLATVVCVPLTSNLKWADAPGNVLLGAQGVRRVEAAGELTAGCGPHAGCRQRTPGWGAG